MKTLLLSAALGLAAATASAANLYWDAAGTTIDGASQGGTGTWTTGNWDTGTLEQLWVDGNDAFIGATSNITLLGGTSAAPTNITASSLTITGGTTTLFSDIAPTTAGQPVAKLTLTGGGAINNAAVLVLGSSGAGSLANTRPVALILGGNITNTGGIGQVQVRGNSVVSSDGVTARTINADLFLGSGDGTNTATFGYGTNTGNLTFTGNLTSTQQRFVNVLTGTTVTVNGTATTFGLASQSGSYNGTFKVLGGVTGSVSNTGGGTLELAGPVSGASTAVTNSGTGTTLLSGANSYGGATNIQNGTLQLTGSLSNSTALNLGDSSNNSGKLILGNSGAAKSQTVAGLTTTGTGSANAIVGGGNASVSTLTVNLASGTNTFGGTIGGTGTNENAIALTKSGAGTLTLNNAASSFSGNVIVSGGTLATGTTQGGGTNSYLGVVSGSRTITVNSGATVNIASNNLLGGAGKTAAGITAIVVDGATYASSRFNIIGNLTLNNGAALVTSTTDTGLYEGFEFIGGTVTVGGTSASTISSTNSKANHLAGGRTTTFAVADVNGTSAADLTVSNVLRDGSGDYTGAGALTKTGAGTMVLGAANIYTGATTVNAGRLLVNGSLAAGSAVGVNNAGTVLGGTGTINGAITVGSGAILQGGDGTTTGTLTTAGGVSLGAGSIIQLAVGATGATHSTIARTGGTWSFQSNQQFTLIDAGAVAGTTYTGLITGLTGTEAGLGSIGTWTTTNGWSGVFSYNAGTNSIDYQFNAIPEPSTYGLLGAGALVAVSMVRRRKRAAK